jgi:hypothetical protein
MSQYEEYIEILCMAARERASLIRIEAGRIADETRKAPREVQMMYERADAIDTAAEQVEEAVS